MEPGSRGLESNHQSPACSHRLESQAYRMTCWASRGAESHEELGKSSWNWLQIPPSLAHMRKEVQVRFPRQCCGSWDLEYRLGTSKAHWKKILPLGVLREGILQKSSVAKSKTWPVVILTLLPDLDTEYDIVGQLHCCFSFPHFFMYNISLHVFVYVATH